MRPEDQPTITLEWPFVVTRTTSRVRAESFELYLREMEERVLAARRPFASIVVTDGERGGSNRKRQVEWAKEHQEEMKAYCRATAIVAPQISTFMRVAFSTILTLMGDSATPAKMFSAEDEARAWCTRMLHGTGISKTG